MAHQASMFINPFTWFSGGCDMGAKYLLWLSLLFDFFRLKLIFFLCPSVPILTMMPSPPWVRRCYLGAEWAIMDLYIIQNLCLNIQSLNSFIINLIPTAPILKRRPSLGAEIVSLDWVSHNDTAIHSRSRHQPQTDDIECWEKHCTDFLLCFTYV